MIRVSLCGCIRVPTWKTNITDKIFQNICKRHYAKYSECNEKAENESMWKYRKTLRWFTKEQADNMEETNE